MEKDKRPQISRRDLIKMTGAGVALAAALGTGVLIPGRANARE